MPKLELQPLNLFLIYIGNLAGKFTSAWKRALHLANPAMSICTAATWQALVAGYIRGRLQEQFEKTQRPICSRPLKCRPAGAIQPLAAPAGGLVGAHNPPRRRYHNRSVAQRVSAKSGRIICRLEEDTS
jgi:hypothetical protein